jgi:ADP-heptose:LPS heptosyltransferase
MNLAIAVNTPAIGLFGATPVLLHARYVHVVLPDDGRHQSPDGMQRISPGRVLARIAQDFSDQL